LVCGLLRKNNNGHLLLTSTTNYNILLPEDKMLEVSRHGKKILVSIDQDMISNELFLKFIERMKIEEIAQKSRLREKDAYSIAEEMKADWWDKNKDQLLKGINE